MKKLYTILCGLLLGAGAANAQCPAGRYTTELFPTVSLDSVVYSVPYSLKMDIYQPVGDALPARPLIILGHGGSFIEGTRSSDVTVDSLCVRFARRGYVTASIDYRLTTFANMVSPDSTVPIDEVAKAMSDGKAAIRYFMKDAATTNTYKIDTNNIFIGGNSAGAVLYMHVGYLGDISECPPHIATAMAANGGFEGNSGNAGYTTKTKAVIDLAGALNMASFINPSDKPSVNFQGTADNVVPYNCGKPLGGFCQVKLCGMGVLESAMTSQGVYHMTKIFPGQGHVPWSSNAAMFKTVDSLTTIFLYNLVCTNVVSVNEINASTEVSVYPNPADERVTISTGIPMKHIVVQDATGRVVASVDGINNSSYEVNTASLARGMYFIKVQFTNDNNTPVVKRLIVE
ncbi:MAG: T9SS type A sorting domain-containing protein [Bacteroidota bacterium]